MKDKEASSIVSAMWHVLLVVSVQQPTKDSLQGQFGNLGFTKESTEELVNRSLVFPREQATILKDRLAARYSFRGPHWDSMNSSIDLRPVDAGGKIFGIVPLVTVEIQYHKFGDVEQKTVAIEMTERELKEVSKNFEGFVKELENYKNIAKEKFGHLAVEG